MSYEQKLDFAVQMRANMTPSEQVFWDHRWILVEEGSEARLVRQKVIRGYIADFYAPAYRAVIEIDGGVHLNYRQWERDGRRDEVLMDHGYSVCRIQSAAVVQFPDLVMDCVVWFLTWAAEAKEQGRSPNRGWIEAGRAGLRVKYGRSYPVRHVCIECEHLEKGCTDPACGANPVDEDQVHIVIGS